MDPAGGRSAYFGLGRLLLTWCWRRGRRGWAAGSVAGLLALLFVWFFPGTFPVPADPTAHSPSGRFVVVKRVIDGDTVELATGELVRYVGIDTPEVRVRSGDHWLYVPEPLAEEAMWLNRQLVEGRLVRLEEDVQPFDRYGRRLAYLFVDDLFVNAELVKQGLAKVTIYSPNEKYQPELEAAQAVAQARQVGRWMTERP